MHSLDDVVALGALSQPGFSVGCELPDTGPLLRCQSHVGEHLQAADEQVAMPQLLNTGVRSGDVDDALLGQALQLPVEAGPALLGDVPPQACLDLELGAWTEPLRGDFGGPMAHALAHVI